MVDLQTELLALIQAVRKATTHIGKCRDWPEDMPCICQWQARFEAELARRFAEGLAFPDEVLDAAERAAVEAGNVRANGEAFDLDDAARAERYVLQQTFLAAARKAPHAD